MSTTKAVMASPNVEPSPMEKMPIKPLQHQPHPALFTDAELLDVIAGWRDEGGDRSDALLAQLILQNRGHR